MTREEARAQEISRQVEALLSGQQNASADPLLDTARLLAESAPAAPSPIRAPCWPGSLRCASAARSRRRGQRRGRCWQCAPGTGAAAHKGAA